MMVWISWLLALKTNFQHGYGLTDTRLFIVARHREYRSGSGKFILKEDVVELKGDSTI